MTTYFLGPITDISDWTERYNTTPTWTGANPLDVPSTATNDWSALTWNTIDSDGDNDDAEILLKFTTDSSYATSRFLLIRGSGGDETATHYHFSMATSTASVGYCLGSDTRTNIASASFSPAGSTTYWVRFRVNGTTIRARWWADGGGEPGTWDIDTTDSNVSAAGWVGLCAFGTTSSVNALQIGIGTNGDTAPSSGGGGAAALESAVSTSATTTAGLTTAIQCAASVSGSASVSAALTTAIQCAASVSATATVSASLAGGAAALEASASGAATVAAGLTTAIRCVASVACSATVSASLTTGAGGVAADVSGSATVAAALTTSIRCAASVTCTASVTGTLAGGAAALQASVNGAATVNATLTGSAAQLAAAAIAQAQATAALSTAIRMAASLQLSATQSASLTAGPLDVFVREPHAFALHGVPRDRTVRLDKPARQIGELLKGQ